MRLGDLDELVRNIDELGKDAGFYRPIYEWVSRRIKDAPTVDAVPVVRCKDCKRSKEFEDHLVCNHALPTKSIDQYFMVGTDILAIVKPDDFCSYGERKDGDSND